METKLAERVRKLKPSATLAINAKAKSLKAQGVDIINLSAGEPDFDTPEHIKQAAIKALEEGFTKYTPVAGIVELREAICAKIKEDYDLVFSPEEVVVTCGAKQALFNTAQALFNPEDEVLILSPYWVSYPPIVELAGAKPVIVPSSKEEKFEPSLERIKKFLSPKTKGIFLNSPSNPTGLIYSSSFLQGLAQILLEKGLFIISDDIYDHLRFDGQSPQNIVSLVPDLKSQTIMINGVSKTYAMTGWRIGWAVGPKEIISVMIRIQSQSTSNANSIAQKAALEALTGSQEGINQMRKIFKKRAQLLFEGLRNIPSLDLLEPQGTFYIFVDFSAYYHKKTPQGKIIQGSLDMSDYLLEEARVATVPGIAFGEDNFLRLSFANSEEALYQGVMRIKEALRKLI